MAYTLGPYGAVGGNAVTPATVTTRAKLSSSRKIDARTMRYVPADDGGFDAMDDIAQCVLLLTSFVKTNTGRIDPRQQERTRQDLRLALKSLTDGPEPKIKIVEIVVTDDGRETSNIAITYTNLLTGTQQTVEP